MIAKPRPPHDQSGFLFREKIARHSKVRKICQFQDTSRCHYYQFVHLEQMIQKDTLYLLQSRGTCGARPLLFCLGRIFLCALVWSLLLPRLPI